jgi:hypothetical protein
MDGASFVCVKNLRVLDKKTGLKNGKKAIFKGLSVACPPYGARSFGHLRSTPIPAALFYAKLKATD